MYSLLELIQDVCHCIPHIVAISESSVPAILPDVHKQLLCKYSAVSAFHGYYRLLPFSGPFDLTLWNDDSTWKYPLAGLLDEYLVIATTALGVQFAYRLNGLRESDDSVYEINFEDFEIEKAYETFEKFAEKELVRNADVPYDDTVSDAFQEFGELTMSEMLLYNPPLLFGGKECVKTLNKLDSIEGMRFMADIKASFNQLADSDPVVGVTTFLDSQSRLRWKINTSIS